jgi:hypothetical protein
MSSYGRYSTANSSGVTCSPNSLPSIASGICRTPTLQIFRATYARVWRGGGNFLRRQSDGARQLVSELLDGRIAWTPQLEAGRYKYKGGAKFDGLFEGVVVTQGVTSPRGTETDRIPFVRDFRAA